MVTDSTSALLATCSADRTVRVWDIEGGFCTHSFSGHNGVVLRVLFLGKELQLISSGDDGEIKIWDLITKSCIATHKPHVSACTCLSLSPNGWTLVTGGRDSIVTAWDLRMMKKIATLPVYEALEAVAVVQSGTLGMKHPDEGVLVATGGEKGVIKVWDIQSGRCVLQDKGHYATAAGNILDIVVSPLYGGCLLGATQDCRLALYKREDINDSSCLTLFKQLIGNNDEVTDLRFLTTDRGMEILAVSTNSEHIRLFNADNFNCIATLTGHTDIVLTLDAVTLPSGQCLLASGSKDSTVRIWTIPEGKCIAVGQGHVSAVSSVAFSRKRSSGFIVTGGTDKLLKVWDTSTLELDSDSPAKLRVISAVAAHDKDINSVALSPNDAVLVTGSQDRMAKVWMLPSLLAGPVLKGHKRGIWSVLFSPTDQAVATASGDKTIKIWNFKDGSCLRTFEGHLASVLRISFVSAGTQLLSSGADGLLKLWDVRSTECLGTFEGHEDKVWALAPHHHSGDDDDGHMSVASGGGDGSIIIWEDCSANDAAEVARSREEAVLVEHELLSALSSENYAKAAFLALKAKHPGRLLTVLKNVNEKGASQSHTIMLHILEGLDAEQTKQFVEYCRDWNTNAKTCGMAQLALHALFQSKSRPELLQIQGIGVLLEGIVPYSQRHFSRVDRLLRSTFLVDYILSSMHVLSPDTGIVVEEQINGNGTLKQKNPKRRKGM